MRFDDLFDDLADAAAGERARALWDEAQELARTEAASLGMADLVRCGMHVRLWLRGARVLGGTLTHLGDGWFGLRGEGAAWMVPGSAVLRLRIEGGGSGAEQPGDGLRMTLPRVLRVLARDRAAVRVMSVDGAVSSGRLLGVGADHLLLLEDGGRTVLALDAVTAVGT